MNSRIRHLSKYFTAAVLVLISSGAFAQSASTVVRSSAELHSALNTANSSGGNRTILVADGTYTLSDTLYVNAPNITIAGQSGNRTAVIIQGDAMSSNARIGNLIRVAASNFRLQDVTLQKAGWHLVQIAGEANADSPILRNCILRDSYQQLVKVSKNESTPTVVSDNGLVENCEFSYTAGRGPQYYIGGLDAHGARNWVVRNNVFKDIASPSSSVAEFAVHFWNGSADNVVERNQIIDCDRGIGFGMQGRGNSAGVIRNNMIYHSANGDPFADVGISLMESQNTQVYNNTVFLEHPFQWAIEYRFANTRGVLIVNNLTNKSIASRDGGSGTTGNNVTNAEASWFVKASAGDLHLASKRTSVVDSGRAVSGLSDDYDGQARPSGAIDIGADEIANSVVPQPPTDLKAT